MNPNNKRLMLSLLKHPAKVYYKDDTIVVLDPQSIRSIEHYLEIHELPIVHRNDDEKYVVHGNRGDKFLITFHESGWLSGQVKFAFHDSLDDFLEVYPSLKIAFKDIVERIAYLPMIDDQTDELIDKALKDHPSNARYINRPLSFERQLDIMKRFPQAVRHMEQTIEMVEYGLRSNYLTLSDVQPRLLTKRIYKIALDANPMSIQRIPAEYLTEQDLLKAIGRRPAVLVYIRNPTLDMYIVAARAGQDAWNYIPDELKKKVRKSL